MLKITKGKTARALKVVVYGSEGIGKTTICSHFPDVLFLDTEGSTAHLDVRRISGLHLWEELIETVREIAVTQGVCKTLVLDTADWAEQMCVRYVCDKYQQNSIEGFGYGKGYVYLSEEFAKLLNALDAVLAAGIHVVITAHAKMRKFEQPDEMGNYDRWEMKLSRQVAPLLKEWCDLLLFLNYKTYVITTEQKTNKVQGGKRVMFTTHHPCWDAKNRFGLPEELPLDFSSIAHLFDLNPNASQEKPIDRLRKMMAGAGITEDQVTAIAVEKGKQPEGLPLAEYPDNFLNGWAIKHWEKIVAMINQPHSEH